MMMGLDFVQYQYSWLQREDLWCCGWFSITS